MLRCRMVCVVAALVVADHVHAEPSAGLHLGEAAALPVDDGCARGDADGACSLSLRQLRGNLHSEALQSDPEQDLEAVIKSEIRPQAPEVPTNSSSCFLLAPESVSTPFMDAELDTIRTYLMHNVNIQNSGAVVAAPDHNTGEGGDYYFHWQRDGALTMLALLTSAESLAKVDPHMRQYVRWVRQSLDQPQAHANSDIRVEPKFVIESGSAYGGIWCRPQTDAPGLIALTLSRYALQLLEKQGPSAKAYIMEHLWANNSAVKEKRVITYDLDWVVHNYTTEGCDLWEEVWSDDFFWGRYTMRAGLDAGAKLASALGDEEARKQYLAAKKEIEGTLMQNHWNGKYIDECRSQPCEKRMKDSAVIEAFNVGGLNDGFLDPLSNEVLGTVIVLNDEFCKEYEINWRDTKAKVPGILYGRYSSDIYDGGNPWVLLTASLARLIYRQAAAALEVGGELTEETGKLLKMAYGVPTGLKGKRLGDTLLRAGDGIFERLNRHLEGTELHMAEQLDRKNGKPLSAQDLTWNYANTMLAIHARDEYLKLAS